MANDIHVWLSDEEADQVRAIAKREDRSLTNMARALIREALAARPVISPHKTVDVLLGRSTDTPEPCVTTDQPPKHDLAAQVRTLGADSLLPPDYKPKEPEVTPRFKAAKGKS